MTDKKETERMLFLADYFINGNVPDSSDELRKTVLKNFGEDYVGQKEVNDPGFFSAVKRAFGLGGTHKENVTLKDKMKAMSDDDLRTFLDEKRRYVLEVNNSTSNSNRFLSAINAFSFHSVNTQKRTELKLWEAVQEFSQTKFAKLHSADDLSDVLMESVMANRAPTALLDFFESAKEREFITGVSPLQEVREMSNKVIVPLVKTIRESDRPTLNAMANFLQDRAEPSSHVFLKDFGKYLMMAYAREAEKNREEAKSKSRVERLERGSVEGENDERNEMKGAKKSPNSSERKYSTQPNRGESR